MDRLAGVFAAVDVPNVGGLKHTVLTWRSHLRIPVGPNPIRNGYATRVDTLSRINKFGFNPNSKHPGGLAVWEIYISHHKREYRSEPWRQPYITSDRLEEFCDNGEIQYVHVRGPGVVEDLDFVEQYISKSERKLAVIGSWLQHNLWISVRCICGRDKSVSASEIFGRFPPDLPVAEALKVLRCRECNASAVQSVTPYFADGLTAFERYRTGNADYTSRPKLDVLDELYENVGGDGEGTIYLSDNLWIEPSGTIQG
jgi:hypothetical protein